MNILPSELICNILKYTDINTCINFSLMNKENRFLIKNHFQYIEKSWYKKETITLSFDDSVNFYKNELIKKIKPNILKFFTKNKNKISLTLTGLLYKYVSSLNQTKYRFHGEINILLRLCTIDSKDIEYQSFNDDFIFSNIFHISIDFINDKIDGLYRISNFELKDDIKRVHRLMYICEYKKGINIIEIFLKKKFFVNYIINNNKKNSYFMNKIDTHTDIQTYINLLMEIIEEINIYLHNKGNKNLKMIILPILKKYDNILTFKG